MPWRTTNGVDILQPWEASGKPAIKWTENDKEWINKYTTLFNVCYSLDVQLSRANAENLRLKHENEFMLKLINANMKDEF